MIEINKTQGDINISLQAIAMGSQWNIVITGGAAHLGAVALAIPRLSLSGSGKISASASVLSVTGHMDDEIARPAALFFAKELNQSVVVSCGIHYDQISAEAVQRIKKLVEETQTEFLEKIRI
ncbi:MULTISPECIES: hypothetical protein [Sporomusa]|jgi:hypothetical protein|uniref:Prenylated flavin chaperone LpdD-like domain-containing protein n=1 Tax=Sporomusa termitida TaxID=2377 RepID=A0A517DWL3_9FIRM|nr:MULTISPECIES: hypothetical protein [Sporomusa]MDF2873382.1 hypothetical protein [Sporomusa sp.]QDR81744.1 hypothetical protein SPTER_31560 [Sporomusa termitida]HWR09006.1 hypothetical protein [Sporomusa sp.]